MMITDGGTIIRTPACDVPSYSRTASGVIMMRLSDGQTLVNFTKVKREADEDAENVEDSTENIENVLENVADSTVESDSADSEEN
jgi:DNA gyrase/topoisomerase IV subunit A